VTRLLDANVLIALLVADHTHHDAVELWLTDNGFDFATCPITQGSLVRLLVRNGQTGTARSLLMGLEADTRHEFWPDELPYTTISMKGVISHRQVTDAYLAQLARERKGRLATFAVGLAELHADVAELVPAG
jgi:uncharacterized protein